MDTQPNSQREHFPLEHLDPNHMTRFAYGCHVLGDPNLVNKAIKPLVEREFREFMSLFDMFPPLSREAIFLSRLGTTVTSLAQDITRRKGRFLEEKHAAEGDYERTQQEMESAVKWTLLLKAGFTVGKLAVFATVGVALSKILQPYMPIEVVHETGTRAPSVLFAAISIMLGGYISHWWSNKQRSRMYGERSWRREQASLRYDQGRLVSNQQHWQQFMEAWTEYTGRVYPYTPYYDMLIKDDLTAEENFLLNLRRQKTSLAVSLLKQGFVLIGALPKRFKRGVRREA